MTFRVPDPAGTGDLLRFSFHLHVSAELQRVNPSEPIRGGPDSLTTLIYGSGQDSS